MLPWLEELDITNPLRSIPYQDLNSLLDNMRTSNYLTKLKLAKINLSGIGIMDKLCSFLTKTAGYLTQLDLSWTRCSPRLLL